MIRLRAIHVWLVLIVASLGSWLLAEETSVAKLAATAVILIAAFKINMVISHFMELKWQPAPYRMILSGWLALVTLIITGGYWAT